MLESLGLLINAIILLVFLIVLNYSSEVCINNAVKVSELTGFSKTTVGFILVAMTTTLPELSVSVLSAINGEEIGIAIGNALGSNVVNICLIVGVSLLVSSVIAPSKAKSLHLTIKGDIKTVYSGLFAAAIIPLLLVYIGYASRLVGAILVGIFAYQIYRLTRHREPLESNFEEDKKDRQVKRYVILTVLGAFFVVLSAYFIVDSATYIAESLGVPNVVIGATIIAFGTSLPEFANSVKSSLKGHLDLALGNIVGSCFINTTLILGVTLLGASLSINMQAYTDLATFALMASLLLWYFVSNERVGWKEGALLLAVYAIFLGQMLGYGIKTF
ncbi:sodium:calcium antiporter [Candidatus Bathyarchaeota archaeon]|nr:sodium:calcium antiporter [Candidatus Bathyarchaeota archaeon]